MVSSGLVANPNPGGAAGTGWARSAALYECTVAHARTTPLRHAFRYRTYQWLVDLDDLPRPPLALRALAGFSARDHLGDPDRSIRANVGEFLSANGVDVAGGRVLMLAHARVLGYVFNPLTVFWCWHADGSFAAIVAEVHNTYGRRHCYLLHPDEAGRADTGKQFYVSPFFTVEGTYRMSLPEPAERLKLVIGLSRDGDSRFVATLTGERRPAGSRALLRAAITHPWSTALVSARIRWQGIRLYLRGLPVVARPPHRSQEGVQ